MTSPRLHPFLRLCVCALAQIAAAVATGTVVALILAVVGFSRGQSTSAILSAMQNTNVLLATVASYPLALGAIALCRRALDRRSIQSLGFSRARALPNFARGALTGVLSIGLLFALLWVAGAIRVGGLTPVVTARGWGYAILARLGYLLAFLGVGLFEEALFRGYTLHNLNEWLGWRGAVALQAILFALVHLGNVFTSKDPEAWKAAVGALPSLALIAVFFAVSYRKTGSLWFAIGFHTFWNWSLGCLFSLPVSGIATFRLFNVQENAANWLSGGAFGAEGSLFLIPLVLALIYFLSLAPDHPRALRDLHGEEEVAPSPMAPIAPVEAEEEPEEARENRYRARFGSGEGFDSGMLRELKEMQQAREAAERERREAELATRRAIAAREEELRRAHIAAQTPLEPPKIEAAPVPSEARIPAEVEEVESPVAVVEVPSSRPQLETAQPEVENVAVEPAIEVAPPVSAPESAPQPTTPAPPKKARPRW